MTDTETIRPARLAAIATGAALAGAAVVAMTTGKPARAAGEMGDAAGRCTVAAVNAAVARAGHGITIKTVPNGPQLPGGVRWIAASGKLPGYCQVTGSYVTNPKTGKTANFLATLPATWNHKYLQLGCSGPCGYLLMNDPAAPPITITAQGYPGQLIEKGYAMFGDDLGHVAPGPAGGTLDFLKKPDGSIDRDALDDFNWRADMVLSDTGKAFTRAFYGDGADAGPAIARSYFEGCSQGGRDALMAATRYPEKFDGIISGAPAMDTPGVIWTQSGRALLAQRSPFEKLTAGQVAAINRRVLKQCDALDGQADGLIQNPAACGFDPARDIPVCAAGEQGDNCVSKAQAASISTLLAATTDGSGALLHPATPVGVLHYDGVTPVPAATPIEAQMRSFIAPSFAGQPLASGRAGGPGGIAPYHLVLNGGAYADYYRLMRPGTITAADFGPFFQKGGKLLWYADLADESLTPYMTINAYKQLAAAHGGYPRLQRSARLFSIPNAGHCGMNGDGPSNFDAIGALEAWVERGVAPDALLARSLDPKRDNVIAGQIDWSRPAPRTMPLCAFPAMARYKGAGDRMKAENWECRSGDTRMLAVAASGRMAGAR